MTMLKEFQVVHFNDNNLHVIDIQLLSEKYSWTIPIIRTVNIYHICLYNFTNDKRGCYIHKQLLKCFTKYIDINISSIRLKYFGYIPKTFNLQIILTAVLSIPIWNFIGEKF